MRKPLMLIASSVLIGTAAVAAPAIAAPSTAQARFGAGAPANGAVDVAAGQPTQFSAQQRSQRTRRPTSPPRSYARRGIRHRPISIRARAALC